MYTEIRSRVLKKFLLHISGCLDLLARALRISVSLFSIDAQNTEQVFEETPKSGLAHGLQDSEIKKQICLIRFPPKHALWREQRWLPVHCEGNHAIYNISKGTLAIERIARCPAGIMGSEPGWD